VCLPRSIRNFAAAGERHSRERGAASSQVVCPTLHYAQTLQSLIGFKVYLYNFQYGPVRTDLAVEAGLVNPVYKESHHWASHGSNTLFLFHNQCRKCHHRGCASNKVRLVLGDLSVRSKHSPCSLWGARCECTPKHSPRASRTRLPSPRKARNTVS
jgi:hypothetical protein